jgi:YVTN family beta-propeller protein
MLVAMVRLPGSQPVYDPPRHPDSRNLPAPNGEPFVPLPIDDPFLNDPPDPFSDPFGGPDFPDPIDFPPPIEDPFDDPFDDIPLPPDPWELEDPFPEVPSEFDDPFDAFPQLQPGVTPKSVAARATAANVVTTLMPFPMRLPFHPAYSGKSATPTKRNCNASNASQLIVAESKGNKVAFVNTCPWQVVAHVPVGTRPVGLAITPDGSQALVANYGNGNTSGTVSVVSLSNRSVSRTITLPAAAPDGSPVVPNGIAFLPDGSRAYVSSHGCNPGSFVFIIDMATFNITGNVAVGCAPSSVKVTPDGSQLWVSSRGASRVDVFDTATNLDVVAFNVQAPTGIAFNPTGTTAYVGEGISPGNVVVIDTSTYQITTRIPVGDLPHAVKVTPSGHHVFVTNGLSNSISQISTTSNTVVRTIKLPNGLKHPLGLTFIQ